MRHRVPARALLLPLLLAAALGACGGGLSGTFEEESGLGQLEFRPDGTVYLSLLGVTVAGRYELDGQHVIVRGPNGTQVLTRRGTRLEGGLGMTYVQAAPPSDNAGHADDPIDAPRSIPGGEDSPVD